MLGGVDAGAQPVQRLAEPLELVGDEGRAGDGGRRGRTGAGLGGGLRRGVRLGGVLHDDTVEPVAERHALATRKILGDFTRPRIDTFNAPRCARTHPNRPQDVRKTLAPIPSV